MIDFHVHSNCSGDCAVPMLEACRAAVDSGIKSICFTEHLDFEPTDSCFAAFDYDLYQNRIQEAQELFGDDLDIRSGIEVDYQPKYQLYIEEYLKGKSFDYVLGATHYVDGVILEDHDRYFTGKSAEQAYMPYFDNTLVAVQTGIFDALAHLDLCKRYGVRYFGPFDWTPYRERIEQILREVISHGMALEINTSGMRQSPMDTYPSADLLQLYFSLGGRLITIGSDAHKSEHVGAGVADAYEIAKRIGFESIATFSNRKLCPATITAGQR